MANKRRFSVTIDAAIVRRIDRIAKAAGQSRSGMIEQLCRDGVDDAETAVQAFTDPVLLQAFAGAFGNRDVLKAMASAVHEEMTDSQLDLFVDRLKGLAGSEGGPQGARSESARPAADTAGENSKHRGSGRRESAKRRGKG